MSARSNWARFLYDQVGTARNLLTEHTPVNITAGRIYPDSNQKLWLTA